MTMCQSENHKLKVDTTHVRAWFPAAYLAMWLASKPSPILDEVGVDMYWVAAMLKFFIYIYNIYLLKNAHCLVVGGWIMLKVESLNITR